ncbi:Zinc knuckle [Popillia japonica]|uniref:Zinc knuckle n=1 Tax=Popillia japonica TaxID=7064 RepID=A0AAW1LA72_POPJA
MASNINVGQLSKIELDYQLKIRGVSDDSTADVMRKTLRGLIKLETSPNFVAPEYPFTFAEDKVAIEKGLQEITDLIAKFTEAVSSTSFSKINTKVTHYVSRANRSIPVNEDDKQDRSKFLVRLVNLSSRLESKAKFNMRASSTGNQTVLATETLNSDSESPDQIDDDVPLVNTSVQANTVKIVPVFKWNLTYSGDNRVVSVNAFLEKIEKTRIARGVSQELLFTSALDIFTDKALIWYRANRKLFSSWNDLVHGLREQFLPVDYDEKLLEEVKHRTQGNNETIGVYISVMTNLFARFCKKIPDTVQLKVLLKNILPFYQTQLGLVEVTSIQHLLKLCRQLEAKRVSVESFVPPSAKNKTLEPDLAYAQINTEVANVNISPSTRNVQNCWNCGRSGHRSSQCRQPRTKHCYRCGFPQVICPFNE